MVCPSRLNDQLYESCYSEHTDNLEFAGNVAVKWKEGLFLHPSVNGYLKHAQIKETSKFDSLLTWYVENIIQINPKISNVCVSLYHHHPMYQMIEPLAPHL